MTKPQLPTYDPDKDGNRFAWIIAQSKVVREQRQQASQHCRFNASDMALLKKHDAEIELEDEQRLRSLRAKYDPARNRATK